MWYALAEFRGITERVHVDGVDRIRQATALMAREALLPRPLLQLEGFKTKGRLECPMLPFA
jgi:hypothetical protein